MKMFGMNVIVNPDLPADAFMLVSENAGPPRTIEAVTWQDGRMNFYSGPHVEAPQRMLIRVEHP